MTGFKSTHDVLTAISNEQDRYLPRIVCFMDILGFAALVSRANNDKALRDQLVMNLRWIQDVDHDGQHDFRMQQFSDSIVISMVRSPTAALALLASVRSFMLAFISMDVPVRGAIAVGNLYVDDTIIFGTGFNEAYRAEQSFALYPRVVLSSEFIAYVREEARALKEQISDEVLRDEDGVYFVNYLKELAAFNHTEGTSVPNHDQWLWLGYQIRGHIVRRLHDTTDNPSIHAKAKWLAKYWNRLMYVERGTRRFLTISELGEHQFID